MVKRGARSRVNSIEDSITFNYFFLLKFLVIITICLIHHNFYELNFIYNKQIPNYSSTFTYETSQVSGDDSLIEFPIFSISDWYFL